MFYRRIYTTVVQTFKLQPLYSTFLNLIEFDSLLIKFCGKFEKSIELRARAPSVGGLAANKSYNNVK